VDSVADADGAAGEDVRAQPGPVDERAHDAGAGELLEV
jgi:hypothetical protein